MNYSKCSFLAITLAFPFLLSGQVNKEDIDKAIDIGSLKHPYLYFTEEEKPTLLNRIENDRECNDIFRRLQAEAKMWLFMPVDRDIPVQGKNTRAGWSEYDRDRKYRTYASTNRDNAFYLAFLYQMTGEQKYADKAFEFADAFCDLKTWTQRAHEFPIIYSRIMPWNVPDDQVNFNVDITNCDAARMMAAVYDWLYPALNEAQRDRIRGALIEKVVTPVRGDYEFHWWATAYRCNWCGVCNSGIGLTGLTLLTENPQLTDIVAESYNRINNMLSELGVDGGWQEGGGYWNYGVHTSTFFADALKRLTKSKYNLFENERLKNNPVTFPVYLSLAVEGSLNFEDSRGSRYIGSSHLINKLASETNSKVAAWYRNEFFSEGNDIFDIIWPHPELEASPPKSPSIHFRTIDWWVMRSDFKSPEKVMVAGKAGMNNDPHHGHLDIGHFVVHWQKEYFIRDLGSRGYDEKYFDDMRFDYPQVSSIGHNVVFVNGEKQISGKLRKQPWNLEVGGEVEDFSTSEKRDYVRMNPTKAYPNIELKEWKRHIVFEKPEITVVLDEIVAEPGSEIEVRFHPGVDFEVQDGLAMLEGQHGKMALIPLSKETFKIQPGKHACQYVNATQPFFWEEYFDTEVTSKENRTIIATLIIPVEDPAEAKQIATASELKWDGPGSVILAFSKKGEKYSFTFENRKGGLVLKK
jgi:hypothetical protein